MKLLQNYDSYRMFTKELGEITEIAKNYKGECGFSRFSHIVV